MISLARDEYLSDLYDVVDVCVGENMYAIACYAKRARTGSNDLEVSNGIGPQVFNRLGVITTQPIAN